MRCFRPSFVIWLTIAAVVVLAQVLIAVVPNLIIGQAQAQCDDGTFCCHCELTWITEHPECDIAAYNKLYDKYCDKNGDLKSSTGNSGGTRAEKIKLDSYPNNDLLTPSGSKFERFVILDVRQPSEYNKGHIAGARNLYWIDKQPKDKIDLALTESPLRKIGVNNTDSLLIYGGADDRASYVFWVLSYLGHKNLSKLDGGIDEAVKQGVSLDKSVPLVKESNYASHIVSSLLVNESQLGVWLERSDVQILDAREYSEYGKARLTNASLPLDAPKLYIENFKIKDAQTLDDLLSRRLDKNKTQLVYGTPEAYSLFYALKLMGYNATILEGSWWKETKWAISMIR